MYARNAFKTTCFYLQRLLLIHKKAKKELKSLCKLEIQTLFIKTNLIKLVFNIKRFNKKRTQSDKGLRDNAFKIARDPKYDGYKRGLASMV